MCNPALPAGNRHQMDIGVECKLLVKQGNQSRQTPLLWAGLFQALH